MSTVDFGSRSRGLQRFFKLILRDPAGLIGLVLVLGLIVVAVFAPQLAPHDPLAQNLSDAKQPPVFSDGGTWEYPLGTDRLGRDVLSRIIFGARVSVTVGFFGAAIAVVLGMFIGLIAGFVGGRLDKLLMSVVDLVLSVPYLIVVIVVAAVLGRSLFNVVMLFGVTASPLFARTTRGEVLRLREAGFVSAARATGARTPRILVSHVLPNLVGPLLTLATFEMSAMIFYEAGLSFLGLSVPPNIPSWGNMLDSGRRSLFTGLPWLSIFPGLAIAVTGLSMNLLGDWLRDVLDPRIRRSRG
ncbi:MAG: ABC transporter permease [Acidimicrobiia bacterium]|nr:ABC transporter permease [Acidimicrobiia bacterium]